MPLPDMVQDETASTADLSMNDGESDHDSCDSGDEADSMSDALPQVDDGQGLPGPIDGAVLTDSSPETSHQSIMTGSDEQAHSVPVPPGATADRPSASLAHHDTYPVNTDSHAYTGADGTIRTRTGRLVKSVNRLIESLVQRPFLKG